jgi:hypothetical protein
MFINLIILQNYFYLAGYDLLAYMAIKTLSLRFNRIVAIAAIDGPVLPGLERNFCLLAALCACSVVHLALVTSPCSAASAATAAAPRVFPCLSAVGTALRFIREPFSRVKLLLRCAENKLIVAVSADDLFVSETHLMTS